MSLARERAGVCRSTRRRVARPRPGREVVAFGAADDDACEAGVEIWDGSRFTVLQDLGDAQYGSFAAQAAAGLVLVDVLPACEGPAAPAPGPPTT